jgi:hypothetical protein
MKLVKVIVLCVHICAGVNTLSEFTLETNALGMKTTTSLQENYASSYSYRLIAPHTIPIMT